ncbi:hypothetical protein Hanom_Chr13g01239971 [Helianthus anomalus]
MYGIYKKNIYMNILRLGYEKPTAFALCASILDLVAFLRLSLFKTKPGGSGNQTQDLMAPKPYPTSKMRLGYNAMGTNRHMYVCKYNIKGIKSNS